LLSSRASKASIVTKVLSLSLCNLSLIDVLGSVLCSIGFGFGFALAYVGALVVKVSLLGLQGALVVKVSLLGLQGVFGVEFKGAFGVVVGLVASISTSSPSKITARFKRIYR